jgi:phospho-N-acetylmuramoyl-pentapeptide-transferase
MSIAWALTGLLCAFVVPATANAVNLHDGLDGLASGTAALILLTMSAIFVASGYDKLAMLCSTVSGSTLAFLVFNRHPARIFMGDTGSLFLGGTLASLALVGGILIWFVPLTLLYILETLSVIVQVVYFRLTKPFTPSVPTPTFRLVWTKLTKKLPGQGKKLFRITPLHHHLESVLRDRGWNEADVVTLFWVGQLILCAVVLCVFFRTRGSHITTGQMP